MEKYKNELEIFKRMYFKNYPTSSKDEEAAAVIQKGGEFIQVRGAFFEIIRPILILNSSRKSFQP